MTEELHFPLYCRIDAAPFNTVKKVLVASTAIPFGVFPSVLLQGAECVDGGLVDNIPIWPLIEHEQCTDIWVIRLRPHIDGTVQKHWQGVDRLLRLQALPTSVAEAMYSKAMDGRRISRTVDEVIDPPVNLPHRAFPAGIRLTVIAPEGSLGGFLSGTMNLRARYAKRLLRQGQNDALRAIRTAG